MTSIINIIKNANKFTKFDINGNKKSKFWLNYLTFSLFPVFFSILASFVARDSFDYDTRTIGALLSLFTGLLFGLLLKISDKVRDIPLKGNMKSENQKNKRIQEVNYLKLFFYFLSYSIIVSLAIITLLIIESFIPFLHDLKLSSYTFSNKVNLDEILLFCKIIVTCFYRFLVVYFLIVFILHILLSVSYLYEYIKFDFSKLD